MKTLRLLSLLLLLAAPLLHAEDVASMPRPTGYVDDYAGVYATPEKVEMEAVCVELHDKTKAQIFIVTVHTLNGADIETFANQLYRKWKIGDRKGNHGVLMLFAIDDHKRRIEIGYGLEGILNDAKVGDIGRATVPSFKAGDYGHGTEEALRSLATIIATDAGVTLDTLAPPEAAPPATSEPEQPESPPIPRFNAVSIIFLILFGGVFLFVIIVMIRVIATGRRYTPRRDDDSGSGSGFSSSSDSGDSSSSSSDSSSSSGSDSFSGGDGGDSGGGGASGDW